MEKLFLAAVLSGALLPATAAVTDSTSVNPPAAAADTAILYGGSCKPSNAAEIFSKEDVDGGLIGGASLVATDFINIGKGFSK